MSVPLMADITAYAVPGRMPQQLVAYWVHGKGAVKIRWGTPGDFDRCVRALRKYFPRNPEGLCNRLHVRATGVAPGQEHSLTEEITMPTTAAELAQTKKKKCGPNQFLAPDGTCVDKEDAEGMSAEVEEFDTELDTVDPDEATMVPMIQRWRSLLAPLNVATGDRRRLQAGAISHRELPLPLMWQKMTGDGHSASVVVGRITGMNIGDSGIEAEGDWLPTPEAEEARGYAGAGVIKPSVDLDDVDYEMHLPGGTGTKFDPNRHCTEDGCEVHEMVVTRGRVSGATLVSIPAFAEVTFEMYEEPDVDGVLLALDELAAELAADCGCTDDNGLVASAAELYPQVTVFEMELTGPTPLTITEDGRVYGHVALWGSCHVGFPGCVNPPHSPSEYAYFHTGEVLLADGSTLPVGKIVVGTPHADLAAGMRDAINHYDNTGHAYAVVRADEDQWGIKIVGVELPDVTVERRAEVRRSVMSGDWRRIGGRLEMIGALAVNVGGFPVPRGSQSQGRDMALVAAGALYVEDDPVMHITNDGITVPALNTTGQQIVITLDREILTALAQQVVADTRRGDKYAGLTAELAEMDRERRDSERLALLADLGG